MNTIEYPLFAIQGKALSVEINENFKGNDIKKVIGIYNNEDDGKQYSICLNDNSVLLKDINRDNNQQSFKEYNSICKHTDCEKDGKLIKDTVFISCFHHDEIYYNYTIINLKNDIVKTSRDYSYGQAFPISNQVIIEWSRIKLPSTDGSRMIELVKVDAFNFVTGTGQFISCFSAIKNELLLQISTSLDYTKLFVLSRINGEYHFSVREIIEKSGDKIIQVWNFGDSIYSCTIQEPYFIMSTSIDILVYNISKNSSWFIEFDEPVEHGFVTSFENTLIHWNKHNINGEPFLYLNIFDIINGNSIKSIKVDANRFSKPNPPISITPVGNKQELSSINKLLILNHDKEIHNLNFSS